MAKLYFHEQNITTSLLHRRDLKKFLLGVFKREGKRVRRVDIIFCTDEYLLSLNQNFLNHNYLTDTISFLLSSNNKEAIIGEVYVSVDSIKVNAKENKVSYQNELLRVVIHGCLHLCGYLDKPKSKALKMLNFQESYLDEWYVSRETQIGG